MSETTISANNGPGTYTIIGTAVISPSVTLTKTFSINVPVRTAVSKAITDTSVSGGGGVGDGQTESIAQQFLA